MTRRYTPEFLARLRDALPISEIVGRSVQLKRKGRTYVGLCPFHFEKTPSFTVYPDHAYCFGCGWHGDVFRFVMEHDSQTFTDAVAYLAGLANMGDAVEVDRKKAARARKERLERERQERAEKARRANKAAAHVERIVAACEQRPHDYLKAKGFPEAIGLVHPESGHLVIPVRNSAGQVRSAEYITPEGEKKFHPGGQIKGNFVRLREPNSLGRVVLVEGYATGLSVRAALRARYWPAEVWACLMSGNFQAVGAQAKAAGHSVYAVPDHDWWRCKNRHAWEAPLNPPQEKCPECGKSGRDISPPAGERAAAALGCPYWLPPKAGMDANDVHIGMGLDALADALRTFRLEQEHHRGP